MKFQRCEMEKFVQLGEKFGLEGEKLLEFVEKQQALEREERQLEEKKNGGDLKKKGGRKKKRKKKDAEEKTKIEKLGVKIEN